ncbi:MAG: tail fiber domain-containing protein, partial [Pseudomonadota bacterium]
NVGIGTTSPGQKLDVAGNIRGGSAGNGSIVIGNDGNAYIEMREMDNAGTPYIDFSNDATTDHDARIILTGDDTLSVAGAAIFSVDDSSTTATTVKVNNAAANSNASLQLVNSERNWSIGNNGTTFAGDLIIFDNTASATRMLINGSGNVGIGTTNPAAKLDVRGAIHAGESDIYFTKTDHIHTGIGNANGYAAIENASNYNALMILGRTTGGANGRFVRLWDTLSVEGTLLVAGNAYKPGGGSWTATSDARLKEIDGSYEHGLGSIVRLNTVRFHYKKDNPRREPSDKQFVGLVAQDVQNVFPEAVSMRSDGYLDLDTTPINFALINAVKELKAANDRLRAEFEAYKAAHP